ncbi:TetR/AcrR family transcriptional regulator [Sphingomonas jatrophae]|uniref:TetR/AcrR family transcriptional regulator n=1 Tax=Sphingomonas jatrophae TaxID=1166337 RepID=UPI000B80698D|nr:TetR/AcrR family transcriptional regulator [Sphingomonas jatrophae]
MKKVLCSDQACGGDRKGAAARVFEAARDLFYRRGIRAVGVDEIVSQAGVTKPSLYRAFASKDDLVAACLTESARGSTADLDALLAELPDDPEAQLRAIVRHFARKIADPGFRGCPLSNTAVEFPEPGHPGRAVLETCKANLRGRMVGIARGLPQVDAETLADGLILLIEGAMASHHIFGSQGPSGSLIACGDQLISSHLVRTPA